MSTQLPSLRRDGAVVYASPGDFEASWSASISRGALVVRPERELQPLEQLEVYLVIPGHKSPLPLKVEAVSLQPERAMLRLLEPAPAKPDLPGAEPTPSTAPANAPASAPASTTTASTTTAAPVDDELAALLRSYVDDTAPPATTPVVVPARAPTPPPTPPPTPAPTPPPGVPAASPGDVDDIPLAAPVEPRAATPAPVSAPIVLDDVPLAAPVEPASLEPVSLEPVSLEPVSLEPVSLEPVSLEPVSREPVPLEAAEPPLLEPAPAVPPLALDDVPLAAPVAPPPVAPAVLPWDAPATPIHDDDDTMPAPGAAVSLPRSYTPAVIMMPPLPVPGAPRVETTLGPPTLEPVLEPVLKPVLKPVLEPVVEPVAEPVITPVITPPAPIELVPLAPVAVRPVVVAEREPEPIALEPFTAPIAPASFPMPPAPAPPPVAVPTPPPAPPPVAPEPPPPAAPVVAALPPFFTGDALRFNTPEDFAAARPHLEGVGAVLAVADGKLPVSAVDVRLMVGSRETRAKAKVTLSVAAPGTAVVQASERGGFKPLLAELDGAAAPASMPLANASATQKISAAMGATGDGGEGNGGERPEGSGVNRALSLPRSGSLTNPTTAEGVLALPLARAPTDADVAAPSMPLLLRWLRSTRGTLKLEVNAEGHPAFTAVFVDGREIRTPAALATLGKSLSHPRLNYNVVDLGRPPDMTTKARTLHLIADVVRGICAHIEIDELARAFPNREGKCPRAIADVVGGLGLPAQHQRFIKSDVDGNQFLDEIARAAVGGRTVWETMYLLELYNGLSWDDPPAGKKASSRTVSEAVEQRAKTGTFRAPVLDDGWAPFEGKDHFQVLGLHWSSSPTEVAPAYHKLRGEYGPNGFRRPANAATAEKIVKRLDEAYKVLNDANARRAYRREKFNLVWPHQAALLVQKAKISAYRKDWDEAEGILLAAEDMAPSEEAKALLTSVRKKRSGQP